MKKYHPLSEKIVDILSKKINTDTRHSFRVLTAYYLSKVASMMRCNIQTQDRGVIPVNTYVLNLMISGAGKGYSTTFFDREFMEYFKSKFLKNIFHQKAEENIYTLAVEKANILVNNGNSVISLAEETDIQVDKFTQQFNRLGELAFSFDSATVPAVKQMREKLLLASAGSMNLELDEIGSNLSASTDVLTTFLELYDIGLVKQKLIKNTSENIRSQELPGITPTNLLMFGTPSKLLDGDSVEEHFKEFLETGYARRLLFSFVTEVGRKKHPTAKDRYLQMIDTSLNKSIKDVQSLFSAYADRPFNPVITMSENNSIYLIDYQMKCEHLADKMHEHLPVHKVEMVHRYYKTLKLAGAYAFADLSHEITSDHIDYAINVVEDSGKAFTSIMKKQGAYKRLAHYLATTEKKVTQHELIQELPFYKGSELQRKTMMTLASSYGYKNNIIIRKYTHDDIEFFSGETLEISNIDELRVSTSTDKTYKFTPNTVKFTNLHNITTSTGYHYAAHNFINEHRKTENTIPGFDLLICDCDGDISISAVTLLLEKYTFLLSTTKRNTQEVNRFRLIFPMSHRLKLSTTDYAKYMTNVYKWLPFPVDTATKDVARKWESYPGQYMYNQGELIDATLFIPETKKSNDINNSSLSAKGVSNLEKWFLTYTIEGNRANHLYRYGMIMIDAGYALDVIKSSITSMNQSLESPLDFQQIQNSILYSLNKKYEERGINAK